MTEEELRKALKEYQRWTRLSYTELSKLTEVSRSSIYRFIQAKSSLEHEYKHNLEKIIRKQEIF